MSAFGRKCVLAACLIAGGCSPAARHVDTSAGVIKEIEMAEQAVIVTFRNLPDAESLIAFGDELALRIPPELGEFDGHDVAVDLSDGNLYFYGPSADLLWARIESAVRAASFIQGATVLLRYGPPEDGVKARRIALDPK